MGIIKKNNHKQQMFKTFSTAAILVLSTEAVSLTHNTIGKDIANTADVAADAATIVAPFLILADEPTGEAAVEPVAGTDDKPVRQDKPCKEKLNAMKKKFISLMKKEMKDVEEMSGDEESDEESEEDFEPMAMAQQEDMVKPAGKGPNGDDAEKDLPRKEGKDEKVKPDGAPKDKKDCDKKKKDGKKADNKDGKKEKPAKDDKKADNKDGKKEKPSKDDKKKPSKDDKKKPSKDDKKPSKDDKPAKDDKP